MTTERITDIYVKSCRASGPDGLGEKRTQGAVAHAVLFVAGRIRFCHADGTEGESATAPSALIAYSARDVAALENSGIEGFIVYLKPKGENK